jgi:hypothetical protein
MSQPTLSDVHVNRPLSNISVAYLQSMSGFVAEAVFPRINVSKKSDLYYTYPKKQWFRTDAKERSDCQESAGTGYNVATAQYLAKCYAVHKDVGDQLRANADDPISVDREATELVTRHLMLLKEQQWHAQHLTTGVWGADETPTTTWNTGGSDPVADVRAWKTQVLGVTGFEPNTLVVTRDVDDVLKDHPVILDRIKYTQRGQVSNELIASLFEVDRYLVTTAVEDSAPEGAAESMGFLSANRGLLAYSAPNPGLLTPSAGYTFSWSGLMGAAAGTRVKKFRIEHRNCDRVEGEMCWDQKIVASDLGVYLNAPLT